MSAAHRARSADALILQTRKRMQKQRKEMREEMRQGERPWTTDLAQRFRLMQASGMSRPESAGAASAFELEVLVAPAQASSTSRGGGASQAQNSPVRSKQPSEQPAKRPVVRVERFHRSMVRREVMRQKFDFLYRQVCDELTEEPASTPDASPSASGTHPSIGRAGSVSHCDHAGQPAAASGHAVSAVKARRAAHGHLHLASSDVASSYSGRSVASTPKVASAVAVASRDPPRQPSAGWRRTDQRRGSQARPPQPTTLRRQQLVQAARAGSSSSSAPSLALEGSAVQGLAASPCGSRAESVRGSQPAGPGSCRQSVVSVATLTAPALLASVSAPQLAACEDLRGVRDLYYGGDDLTMHEDILHCSNPRLFPLRAGLDKPFPLPSLVAC